MLPPGWTEYKTPEGEAYYFHEASGKTTWDKPDLPKQAPPPLPSSAPPPLPAKPKPTGTFSMPFGKAKKPSGAAPSPITNAAGSGGNRGAVPADAAPNELLAAIRGAGGGGLRKTNTVDKTAPRGVGGIVSSSPGTGGASSASAPTKPAVGGGGGIMGELAAKMAQRQAASGSAGAGAGGAPSGRPAPSAAPPAVPGAGVNSGLAAALAARRAASPKSAPPPVPMPQATSAPPPVPVFSKVTPAAASTPTPSVSNGNATVERRLDDIEAKLDKIIALLNSR